MLVRVVALAALGGFLFGYDLGVIGGAMLGISNAFHISDGVKEAIVGAAKLGAFFGTFLGGVAMLRYGRRRAISLQAAFFVAGPVLMGVAPGPGALVAGRLLVGLGIGASAIVVPAYLAEIAPARSRGMVVQMYEVMLTLGMLCAVLVNLGLNAAGGPAAWRWMVGLPAVPGAFLLVSLVSLPESPRWLVMRGQLDAALATLHTIIITSSSRRNNNSSRRNNGSNGSSRLSKARARQLARLRAEAAAVGDQGSGGDSAEAAEWINAQPQPGRPRNPEQQALEQAEDELLMLWSSVQKEQAAGLELRQAAAPAANRPSAVAASTGPAAAANTAAANAAAAAAADDSGGRRDSAGPVSAAAVSCPGGGTSSSSNGFVVQAAPAAAFSLGEEDAEHHTGLGAQAGVHVDQQRQPQQQQQQHERGSSTTEAAFVSQADALHSGTTHSSNCSGNGGSSMLNALQQKLQLGSWGAAAGTDTEGQQQQQLLGPNAISSSAPCDQPVKLPQQQHQQEHPQQHQRQHKHAVEPGQESNVCISLWCMLADIRAVATGPEKAAFAIACCLAVFDQATASTAIINYAPEVLSSRMGVQDPNLAILYPAAIALAKVVGTLIAAVSVDKYGRKPLLVWGGIGCCAFLLLTGVSLAVTSVALFLAALCLFIFCFSLSWAGLYWVVVSELFSMGSKSPATSAATSLLFLSGAAVNFVYLSLIHWMGGIAFVLFAAVAAGSALYVQRHVPETKGKTLTEIQALLLAPSVPSTAAAASSSSPAAAAGSVQVVVLHSPPQAPVGTQAGAASAGAAGCGVGVESGSPVLPISQKPQ